VRSFLLAGTLRRIFSLTAPVGLIFFFHIMCRPLLLEGIFLARWFFPSQLLRMRPVLTLRSSPATAGPLIPHRRPHYFCPTRSYSCFLPGPDARSVCFSARAGAYPPRYAPFFPTLPLLALRSFCFSMIRSAPSPVERSPRGRSFFPLLGG